MQDIEKIKNGNTTHSLKHSGFIEITQLSDAVNKMKEEVEERTRDLELLSTQDPLTGIANRRIFDETIQREFYNAFRSQTSISLLLIDIDYFKRFNDNYGHQEGDACLRTITSAISSIITRTSDLFARYGGEEFVVILPNTDEAGMKTISDLIHRAIRSAAITHNSSPINDIVTLSIGGRTSIPTNKDELKQFINETDTALYEAKSVGRDQTIIYKEVKIKKIGQLNISPIHTNK